MARATTEDTQTHLDLKSVIDLGVKGPIFLFTKFFSDMISEYVRRAMMETNSKKKSY